MRQLKHLLSLLPLTLVSISTPAIANPTNPTVVNGIVTITNPNASTLEITNTPGSIINWQGFSINSGELTHFLQQSPESAILNRVIGSDPSQILGTLQSNGRVLLINPNGILFGADAVINVQGLIASTLNLTDENFLNGNYLFTQSGTGAPLTVETGAQLTTVDGGQIWLLAQSIQQQANSNITTPAGQTVLAAGTQVQVAESALGNMVFNVTTDGTNNLETLGVIASERGAAGLFADNITHSGTITAQSAAGVSGLVVLNATTNLTIEDNSVINVDSSDNSDGGVIRLTAGNQLEVQRLAEVSADGGITGGDGGRITLTAHDLRVSQIANGMQNVHAKARHASGVDGTVTLTETGIHSYHPVAGEFQVNEETKGAQTVPAIAALAGGKLVVTWESDGQDGDGFGVYARIYDPSTNTWSNEFQVNTTKDGDQDTAAVAALPNGNFVVTWESKTQKDEPNDVYGRIFDANGNPQTNEFLINETTKNEQKNSAITALANGNFVVSWGGEGQDVDTRGVFARIFNADGTPQTGELPINTTTDKRQDLPTLTALANGNFVVAWQSNGQDTDQEGIYGRIFDANGVAQTGELSINTTTIDQQRAPTIAALTDGSFLVTWDSEEQDGSANTVIGRRFASNGIPLTDEFQINTYEALAQDTTAITSLGDGGFVVTWESERQDGSTNNSVYGQRFDSQGNPVANNNALSTGEAQGNEFMINTRLVNDQDDSAIAPLGNSGFMVVWESLNQDKDSNGIYTQRFEKTPAPFTPTNLLSAELGPVANFTTRPNRSNGVVTPPTILTNSINPSLNTSDLGNLIINSNDPSSIINQIINSNNPSSISNLILNNSDNTTSTTLALGQIFPEIDQAIALIYPSQGNSVSGEEDDEVLAFSQKKAGSLTGVSGEENQAISASCLKKPDLLTNPLEVEDTMERYLNLWRECRYWRYEEEDNSAVILASENTQSQDTQERMYAQMVGTEEYNLTRSLSWGARQAYWQEQQEMQNSLSVEEYGNYLQEIRSLPEEERVEYFEALAQSGN
ncbi:MAG: filamentous hemagglutinin N-terminal domain-containing protein [Symploca sp. SIO2E6]|nr:filamentous hemagglutinin N-terminal domain-containing protein [Symploca sp. SIO2E6]